jgi:hypothetical protein
MTGDPFDLNQHLPLRFSSLKEPWLEIETESNRGTRRSSRHGGRANQTGSIQSRDYSPWLNLLRSRSCTSVPLTLTKKSSNNKLMLNYRSGDNTIKSHHQIYI